MSRVNLADYDNSWYAPGRSGLVRGLWMFVGLPLFRSVWFASSRLRCGLLRRFGATIGQGVVIRHGVVVKYPWHLIIGDHCWIGEQVWIDNLTSVRLESHVCLSQGVYLCTGNHDWNDPHFGLRIAPVTLMSGSWAGARSVLLPGVTLHQGAVAAAGSVVAKSVLSWQIVAGNPARVVRQRVIANREYDRDSSLEGVRA